MPGHHIVHDLVKNRLERHARIVHGSRGHWPHGCGEQISFWSVARIECVYEHVELHLYF
jgi:hypothetical protein